ncbi:DoxX family protein [Nocardia arthritidis]|uniref:Methylamine utilisation protein MauE domain-containing protein n=1 Tax=Nocardia arthritidis TaxID=228602 RepID=A0A6G9YRW8_9NOCA|nr:MauE/DoxX family redox-associated membrane protein [Nocardia arthritidis]QIS16055.1 hypothetical protein F5544_41225 [Nocardia arthritidis]
MSTVAALLLGTYLACTGISHFAATRYFRSLVPPWLPTPNAVVAVTGLAEVGIGVLLFLPGTRVVGGWLAAVMISGFLVTWLDILRRWNPAAERITHRPLGAAAALIVNIGYVAWAVYVACDIA